MRCRGLSALVSGALPRPPSSLALLFSGLFLTFFFLHFSACLSFLLFLMFSQRHHMDVRLICALWWVHWRQLELSVCSTDLIATETITEGPYCKHLATAIPGASCFPRHFYHQHIVWYSGYEPLHFLLYVVPLLCWSWSLSQWKEVEGRKE